MSIATAEPWLTKRELATRLKVSPRTITRLRLPHTRVGGQNRYLMSQVVVAMSGGPLEAIDNVVPLRPRSRGAAA
jgi:hypothetical protein